MIGDDVYKMLDPGDGLKENFPRVFAQAVKVKVDNVSDYYYTNSKEHWGPDDFPNCAPPWPLYWMEWTAPTPIYTDSPHPEILKHYRADRQPDGVYKLWTPRERKAVLTAVLEPDWAHEFGGARWLLFTRLFNCELPGAYIYEWVFFVNPEGRLLHVRASKEVQLAIKQYLPQFADAPDFELVPGAVDQHVGPHTYSNWCRMVIDAGAGPVPDQSACDVMFLALSFCNCKNVQIEKQVTPEALRKKREKHDRLKLDTFHTIKITPMRKIIDAAGAKGDSLQKRLASPIIRGHFKHYEEGQGLFGKYHGTWWWPMRAKGEVTRDYTIKP